MSWRISRAKTERPIERKKRAQKGESTTHGRPPSPPAGELGYGGRPWPSPADTRARPSHGRAPCGAEDPLLGPRQSVPTILLDISRCLEGQTTSESYETRTVVFVSKIASQLFDNHIDTTSLHRQSSPTRRASDLKGRIDDAWPTPEPPSRGARLWGSAMAEPRRHTGSAIAWPSSLWSRGPPAGSPTVRSDDTSRHFEVFGGSNDL